MSSLFSQLLIRNVKLKNRIVVSPMCQYSSEDGFANDWHMVHLGSRAVGGAGLIMFEASAVSPEGRITLNDLGLWKEEHIPALKKIVKFIESQDCVAGIQLAHAGRKASHIAPWVGGKELPIGKGGWPTLAPSAIPFTEKEMVPEELSLKGIEKVIDDFKNAATRALKAGFKIIELHSAHGYLLHEFLSPLSNQRKDNYGGSFENRIRLLLEVIENIRTVWPSEYPLFVRLSASDWVEEGGWSSDDSVHLAKILKDKGVDLIDCSSGGIIPGVKIPVLPNYQVPFAEKLKKEAGILTGAVGLITDPKQAEEIIAYGKADLVLLAREFLRDPYFPLHAARDLDLDVKWPSQYERAKKK